MSGPAINNDYQCFQKYLEPLCGIRLGDDKAYLIKSRLRGIMQECGAVSLRQLVEQLKSGRQAGLRVRVVDAMTTNETSWFRDEHPFRTLNDVIFKEFSKRRKKARIWSAACSSGQEPYSISMLVEEFRRTQVGGANLDAELIATDISATMLTEARKAEYSETQLRRGLSRELRQRYFVPHGKGAKLSSSVRNRIRFRDLNLLHPYGVVGKVDVIFCRNILIYFSRELKCDILERMYRVLNPGGYLFLGSTEVMPEGVNNYTPERLGRAQVYRPI